MTPRRPSSRGLAGGVGFAMASQRPGAARGGVSGAGVPQTTAPTESHPVWRLWFPARLGPSRKTKVRVNGVTIAGKQRRLELPPTKNSRYGSVYGQAAWVKEWRDEAKVQAQAAGIPALARIRLSAVVYRSRIGIADGENDHARLAPLQDGLVDAKVIPRDTYRFCERGDVREERAGAPGAGVLLIIEPLPEMAVIEPAAPAADRED